MAKNTTRKTGPSYTIPAFLSRKMAQHKYSSNYFRALKEEERRHGRSSGLRRRGVSQELFLNRLVIRRKDSFMKTFLCYERKGGKIQDCPLIPCSCGRVILWCFVKALWVWDTQKKRQSKLVMKFIIRNYSTDFFFFFSEGLFLAEVWFAFVSFCFGWNSMFYVYQTSPLRRGNSLQLTEGWA